MEKITEAQRYLEMDSVTNNYDFRKVILFCGSLLKERDTELRIHEKIALMRTFY